MPRAPPKKQGSPAPKKKLHDDTLSPAKKSHFSAAELVPVDPSDAHSDLYVYVSLSLSLFVCVSVYLFRIPSQ